MARAMAFVFRTLPLLAVLCAPTFAADGAIRTDVSPDEIFMGDSADYAVLFENMPTKDLPDLKHLEADFKVDFVKTETGQSMSVFNGNVTKVLRQVHRYKLTPKRAGTLTIVGPTISIGGQNYKGADQVLVVAAPEKQDLVFAELLTSAPRVFGSQEFEVTLKILLRPLPDEPNRDPLLPLNQPPAIQINWADPVPQGLQPTTDLSNWLQNLKSRDEHGFSVNNLSYGGGGFFGQLLVCNLAVGREMHATLDGKNLEYYVYELKRSFRAEKNGTYSFGPASIKGLFVDGVKQRRYTGRKLVVTSNEASVEVRELPAQRPAGFSGGVGAFNIDASAAPLELRVGDPLTLSLTFERLKGAGSLEQLGAPDLSLNEKLSSDFDIVDKNPTGATSGNTKKFSYSLRPKRAGVSIPEITASLFDPTKEAFIDVKTAPVPLKVSEASALNAAEIVGSLAPRTGQDLRNAEQGVFQNIVSISELQNQRVQPVYAILLAGGAWLWALLSCVWIARRRSFAGDIAWQRRDAARRNAQRELDAARNAKPAEAARHVRAALLGLIADLRNRPAAGLTSADAAKELTAAAVPSDLAKRTLELLETLEALEYAPQSSIDFAVHVRNATALVPELHRALEKTS